MSRIFLFLSTFMLLVSAASGFQVDRLTHSVCREMGGQMVQSVDCPSQDRSRGGHFCKVSEKPFIFFNGCSIGFDFYKETFFPACMKHDLCYHHEPSSTGLLRRDCDKKFKKEMLEICDSLSEYQSGCRVAAQLYYSTVRVAGNRSWECSNVAIKKDNIPL